MANQESEGLLNSDDVSKGEAGFRGGDGEPGDDGEQRDDKSEKEAESIDSYTQPTLIGDRQPVSPGLEGQCLYTTWQKHKQTCSRRSRGPHSPVGTGQLHRTPEW